MPSAIHTGERGVWGVNPAINLQLAAPIGLSPLTAALPFLVCGSQLPFP